MNTNRTLKILVATLLGATWVQAQAAEPDWENWNCKFCPFPESGVEGDASAAVENISDDSARFGDYTGYNEKGTELNADADLMYRGEEGYGASLRARNLGLDSREVEAEAGHQGTWMVDFSYDELPRYLDDTTRTVFSGAGSSSLRLPSGWVRAPSTSGMSALDSSLRPFDLEYDVTTLGVGLEFVQSSRLRYEADWTRQTKEGYSETWGSFIGVAASLARPVDYETDQVDAAVIYTGDNWMVKGAYYGSFFSNKDLALTWDNPFTGPGAGRMANAPDNKFNQFLLSGSFGLDFWDTRINASYASGKMEQDDALLPYTINPSISAPALPRATFSGEVDTVHADLRIVSRPTDRLRLAADYRYDERDNQSSRDTWAYVQADAFLAVPTENRLYGYQDTDFGLAADYRFGRMVHGYAGWDRKTEERDQQDVSQTDEDTYWAKLRLRPFSSVSATLKAETAERDGDGYNPAPVPAGQAQNPLLRKYYLADRDRDAYEAQVQYSGEKLSLSAKYVTASDDYTDSVVGLTGTDYDQIAVDGSLLIGKSLVASAFLARENYDSDLVGAGSFAAPNTASPNWRARTQDEQDLFGLALDWPGLLDDKLDLRFDWIISDTTGDIAVSSSLGGALSSFPTLEGKLESFGLEGTYRFSPRLDILVGWRHETFDHSDWAIEGVGPDTISSVLTFGAQPQEYDVDVISLAFQYKFGIEDEEDED